MKEDFEDRRAQFNERFKKKQEEIQEKQVRFESSYQNDSILKRVKSMDQKSINKFLKPKLSYQKRLNYSQKIRRKNNQSISFGTTKSQNFKIQSLNKQKALHFGQYLSKERQAKAKENFEHRGDFLQYSKQVAQELLKAKEETMNKKKLAGTQSMIGKILTEFKGDF